MLKDPNNGDLVNINEAARRIGISGPALCQRVKKYGTDSAKIWRKRSARNQTLQYENPFTGELRTAKGWGKNLDITHTAFQQRWNACMRDHGEIQDWVFYTADEAQEKRSQKCRPQATEEWNSLSDRKRPTPPQFYGKWELEGIRAIGDDEIPWGLTVKKFNKLNPNIRVIPR